jgi:glycosyltransferase involved in cell wall biosynthesis
MKNVLFLAEELRVGGAETYFYKVENNISDRDIKFYSAAVKGDQYFRIKNKSNFYEYNANVLSKIKVIKKIVKDKKINVIHSNSLRLCLIAALLRIVFNYNYRLYYTKHNLTFLEKISDKLYSLFVNKYVDSLITIGETHREQMIELGINEEKIVVIPNGTDINQFNFMPNYLNEEGKIKIGILARLSKEKNHKFFLEIIEVLQKRKNIEFEAFIAGDGPLRDEIAKLITDKKLEVKMLGNVSEPQIFLSQIDISVIVSEREVFPMAIIEGMAVGTLMLSINVGGIKDVVKDRFSGYLLNDYDSERFADVIEEIAVKRNENISIIKNARKLVESEFELNIMIRKIEDLYLGD